MFNLTKNYILLVIRCILTNHHSFKRITNICIKGLLYNSTLQIIIVLMHILRFIQSFMRYDYKITMI